MNMKTRFLNCTIAIHTSSYLRLNVIIRIHICFTEHTELFSILPVRWSSQLGVLLFKGSQRNITSESIPACVTLPNPALRCWVSFIHGYWRILKEFKYNFLFLFWLQVFLLTSKYPWLSEEGWNSIKSEQAIRGKMPHLAQLLPSRQTRACTRQSGFVLRQRSAL